MIGILILSILLLDGFYAPAGQYAQDKKVDFKVITEGQYTVIDKQMTLVFTSKDKFEEHWKLMNRAHDPTPPLPKVDWAKNQLIVIHLGKRNSGGFSLKVESIKETRSNEWTVTYIESQPADDEIVTMAITSPYLILETQKSNAKVKFVKKTVKRKSPED